jgi:hypothetical protein
MNPKFQQWVEEWTPVAVAAAASLGAWIWLPRLSAISADTLCSVANISFNGVWFMVALKGILASMRRTQVFIWLGQLGALPTLERFFSAAITLCFVTLFESLLLAVFQRDPAVNNAPPFPRWLMLGWVFLSVWAGCATIRVIYFSNRIFRVASSQNS